jgi:hypothetical protein
VGRPQDHTEAERKPHLSAHVVVVQGFVEPIPVSEKHTAHLFIIFVLFLSILSTNFQTILFLCEKFIKELILTMKHLKK